MKPTSLLAVVAVGVLLAVPPAFAKTPHPSNGNGKQSPRQPAAGPSGPTGTAGPKGKAYGYYCQNQSKKHVPGAKGTPFSQCVTAMAKLGSGKAKSPEAACSAMSKKHVPGEKGTDFSRCVSGGAKLLRDQHK